MDSKPADFFRGRVKHVSFLGEYAYPASDVIKILSVCDGIVDLALCDIYSPAELLPMLRTLPLGRLTVCRRQLIPGPTLEVFSHPLFAQITHPRLFDYGRNRDNTWPGLALIPRLTHLAFNDIHMHASVCLRALTSCMSLQVLALGCADTAALRIVTPSRTELARDLRVAMLVVEDDCVDWERGARGGEDMWVGAAVLAQQRQTGKTTAYVESLSL